MERGAFEDGKGKCPYDPAKGHTGLLVGEFPPAVGWASPRAHSHPGLCGLRVCSPGLADPVSTDGELYSATLNNFLGTEPIILRNMGPHHAMKTEYLAFWLNGERLGAGAGMGTGGALGAGGGGASLGPR